MDSTTIGAPDADVPRSAVAGDRTVRRLMWWLVGIDGAVLGILTLTMWSIGWRMMGDDAAIVLHAKDLFSGDPPLIGMPSSFSQWSAEASPAHPGPLGFLPLAPAVALFGPSELAILFTTWALSVSSTALVAVVVSRIETAWTAFLATVFAIANQCLMAQQQVWVPLTTVMATQPLFALCILSWAIAKGAVGWWPVWIGVASFVAHCDLSFSTIVFALGVWIVLATAARVRTARRDGVPSPLTRRTVAWTALVLVLCWIGPAIDAIANDGGNLAEMVRAAGVGLPVAGPWRGVQTVGYLIAGGIPGALGLGPTPAFGQWQPPLLIGIALVALAVREVRRHGTRRGTLAVTALVALAAAVLGQVSTPVAAGIQVTYLIPATVTGCFAWFACWTVLGDALQRRGRLQVVHHHPRRTALACAAVLVGLRLVQGSLGADFWNRPLHPAVEPVSSELAAALPDGSYAWYPLGGPQVTALGHGLALRLDDRGVVAHGEPAMAGYLGDPRTIDGSERGTLYLTRNSEAPPVEGAEPVARWVADDVDPDAVDRAVQAIDEAVASAPTVQFGANAPAFFLGTVIASGQTAPAGTVLDDDTVRAIGQRYLDEPDLVFDLPARTVAELAVQELIVVPGGSQSVQDEIDVVLASPMVTMWLLAHAPVEGYDRRRDPRPPVRDWTG